MQEKRVKTVFIVLIVLLFTQMLLLNFFTPLIIGDDYKYSGSTSILDALRNEYIRYMTWNGRSVTLFLLRLLLMMPKYVFNVLNSFAYIILTLLMYKYANTKNKPSIALFLIIIFSLWIFVPGYGHVVLWVTGSLVYLWGLVIILCFSLPYSLYIADNRILSSKYATTGMFILGLLAGWCLENSSGAAILYVILIIIYCYIFKVKITKWMVSGLIGSIIGYIIMISAPGYRYAGSALDGVELSLGLVVERMSGISVLVEEYFTILNIIFIVLFMIRVFIQKDWKHAGISLVFYITAMATVGALVIAPHHPARAFFGAAIFLIIAITHCLSGLMASDFKYGKVIIISLVCILAFRFTTSFVIGFYDIVQTKVHYQHLVNYVEEEVAKGNLDIIVSDSEIDYPTPRTKWNAGLEIFLELYDEVDGYHIYLFSEWYGLNSIKRTE